MHQGEFAPDFSAPNQDGHTLRLSELLEAGPVVLFFYPAAMTKGCTAESCHFRDLGQEFGALGAQRIGISMDSVAKQAQFAEKNELDFPLLSDPEGAIAKLYGVKRPLDLLRTKRSTFVISQEGVITSVIASEFSMNRHADEALAVLRSIQSSS